MQAWLTYLHTMLRITDPEQSRAFYEALGFTFSRDMDIVRNGEFEATNYFFSLGDNENVLELTFNHDGRTYELGTGYGHIAIGVDDLDATLDAAEGAGHRARARAVPRSRGRLPALLRPRSGRLPRRVDRPQREVGRLDQRISFLTLGVRDLDTARAFYERARVEVRARRQGDRVLQRERFRPRPLGAREGRRGPTASSTRAAGAGSASRTTLARLPRSTR